jgi:beta-lactamase regulating signal transducer with metallopeptidase domain
MSLLQDLFISIVNMSITASYAAIGVILVRLLLKKAPKVFSYILWIPVLFRLVCPFSFDSAFSFFNLINLNAKQGSGVSEFVPQNIGLMQTPAIQSGIGSIDSAANASLPSAIPVASVNPMQIWIAVFSLIWIFGVIALFIYSIISYVKIKRKLQTATRVEANVFETDAIGTAFVCGFIRPKIYVPANIGDANLSYILEHERTHIRRKDYLIKPLAFLALILHWFNPLMWLCFALMSRDMEMSCDESVMHRLGDSAKGGYSGSLLALSVKRKGLLAANPLAFGENHAKARIKNVLNYRKPTFWVIMVAVAAVCAAGFAFAVNPPKGGTISEEDKRKLADVVSEYYMKADPANKGTLKIYNIKKFGSSYLVLTQKYRGEGESFSVLFLADSGFNIVAKAPGDIPISPCFSANVVKYQGKSIVYGNFKNKKWNPQTDLVTDVQIDFIKITFEDGTYVREQVSMDKGYIVVVDTLSNIRNIEVYNSKGELQSDLINESACSEYDFIDVIGEKSSDRITSLIEDKLAEIMSSPKNSSDPQEYINAHQAEYNAILALETQALPYLFTEFEKGGQTGLKGYIMQNLCWDILGEDNIQYASKDPQDWYDTFKKHVQRIAASSSVDSVKANNPKYGALLDVINTHGKEGIAKLVEENLAIIMSSPKQASNPNAYIQAHQGEYENIKKLGGEEALQYMLSQFKSGNAEGLRGHIMMKLCKELLGVRNNVTDETLTPQEWYDALSIRQEVKLLDFVYEGNDPIEKLVYATEIEKNSQPQRGFTIVAPKIFGSYEEDGLLKVFVTTFSATYKLYGNVLDMVSGSVVPSAITYKKDNRGNYVLEKYEQAKDGADWQPSIRKFCTMPVSEKEIPGLADKIIDHYGNRDDIRTLQWENLFKHLKANGIKDATLFNSRGEVEFSISNPQYIN